MRLPNRRLSGGAVAAVRGVSCPPVHGLPGYQRPDEVASGQTLRTQVATDPHGLTLFSPHAHPFGPPAWNAGGKLFEKLLVPRNDLGLLAEEWDPRLKRQVGNFPQAFSHVPLIDTALRLTASGAYGG
ncbi:hypothetical protein SALBM311S_01751 [Streptomyces alboniger]